MRTLKYKCLECGALLKKHEARKVKDYFECISCLGVAEEIRPRSTTG